MEQLIFGIISGAIIGIAAHGYYQNKNFKACKKSGGKIFKKSKGAFFYEEICVLDDKIIKGGFKIGKGETLPAEISTIKDKKLEKKIISKKKIYFALFLSILGLFAWILPILGLPISIYGLIVAIKGVDILKKVSIIAIILCVIGIMLSLINASIGAYQGAHGNNEKVNSILR